MIFSAGPGIYAINRVSVTSEGERVEVMAFALGRQHARSYVALETEKLQQREGELACSIRMVNLVRSKWKRGKYHGHEIPDMPTIGPTRIQLVKPQVRAPNWSELNDRERWVSVTFLTRVEVCRLYGAPDPRGLARCRWDELPVTTRERLAAILAEVKV